MAFDAYDRSLDLLRTLAAPLAKLATRDPDLTKQLRRAATSVTLNITEANRHTGRDRTHLFTIALGSAAEVSGCLDAAVALGYLAADDTAAAEKLADDVRAMTYRLSRR